jgi:hypothetical protein
MLITTPGAIIAVHGISYAARQFKSPFLKTIKWEQTVETLFSQIAAEYSGLAGEFCCFSLHRSQIFKDL